MMAFQPPVIAMRAGRKLERVVRSLAVRVSSWLAPGRHVELYVDRPLRICLPFRDREQLAAQVAGLSQLQRLGETFGSAAVTFVTLQSNQLDSAATEQITRARGSLSTVPDFRSLVSFMAGAQFMIVLPEEHGTTAVGSPAGESLKEWCEAFHVGYFPSMAALVESLQARGPLKISGPFCSTYAVHKSLWLSVMGNQYAFTETLDWDIIKRLPGKFTELSASSEVYAHSIALLAGPLNRITRQRAIGKLYQEYLQGESVLDIGCDVRGVSDFVGAKTRYVGIDMHGKPDLVLNLDREALPFEAASIDTIVCVETLEHLQRMHAVLDNVMSVARKHVICSLPVEAAHTGNRLVDPLGGTHSFGTPLAPVFDRHQWLGNIADSLDLIYYRAARGGFGIRRLDLFYMPRRGGADQSARVLRSFRRGMIADLNSRVGMIVFVLERKR